MELIEPTKVRAALHTLKGQHLFLHLETTAGAYTPGASGAFIRNAPIHPVHLDLEGTGPYRAGIETDDGFIYAEGLSQWGIDKTGRLTLTGYEERGRLAVCLELSPSPLPVRSQARQIPATARTAVVRETPDSAAPSSERHVLTVHAHPDDETFGWGGTIALYTAAGVPVTSVCATLGQMGRNLGDPAFATRETLGPLREKELRRALDALGVGDLILLGIWDKTVEFQDQDLLTDKILSVMRQVRPSLVLTSHPVYGGHPDHCAVGAATLRAVASLPPGQRPRLFGHVPPFAGAKLEQPVHAIDVSTVLDRKIAAIEEHRSQSELMLHERAKTEEELAKARKRMSQEAYVELTLPTSSTAG